MIKIGNKEINGKNTFIIAEMSGNHKHNIQYAYKIIESAAKSGADAIKLQTYTADTITLNSDNEYFQTDISNLWSGKNLYKLYSEAYTPWEWHKELKEYAESLGLVFFSSPFDITAVDFLEKLDVPCYKIASFEINDIHLLNYIAKIGKPVFISTGAATYDDITKAVNIFKHNNCPIVLLKCTSSYPAPYEDMNLSMINKFKNDFGVLVGLSDHSLGSAVPIASIALGACVIEKHLTFDKNEESVDSAFSLDPTEFKEMVNNIRNIEKAIGNEEYKNPKESSLHLRRSLFSSKDIKKGDIITKDNIKSVRPATGLSTEYYEKIIGMKATRDIKFATPLELDMFE